MMVKLSQEHIAFIDRYLENSDVIYADIRMEMVDHVASEIEARQLAVDTRDFYDLFKEYMIAHKTQLLADNKAYSKQASRKLLKSLLKEIPRLKTLAIWVCFFLVFQILHKTVSFRAFKSLVFAIPFLLTWGFAAGYMVYTHKKKLNRFSIVERLSFPFIIFYQLVILLNNVQRPLKEEYSVLMITVVVSLVCTLFIVFLNVVRQIVFDVQKTYVISK